MGSENTAHLPPTHPQSRHKALRPRAGEDFDRPVLRRPGGPLRITPIALCCALALSGVPLTSASPGYVDGPAFIERSGAGANPFHGVDVTSMAAPACFGAPTLPLMHRTSLDHSRPPRHRQ